MSLTAGTRLGPYEILSPLGAGGMGEVYRGRDTRLAREVAIKVLPETLAGDPEALRRFEREAVAVAALSHPNILAIHDFGTQDGMAYAVTELLEGETLRDRLASGPIAQSQAVDYALQIAKGLSAAHERGVVHRDLKPENVFVSRDGHVKILDFGLAKREEKVAPGEETSAPTQTEQTTPGTVMGTLGYMSPEQVRGLPVDHRTDIFSFGAVLYEMLSGKKAFKRETSSDTIAAIMRDPPADLDRLHPQLARVVSRCVEKDRDRRFPSAREITFALAEGSSAASVAPVPESRSRRTLFVALSAAAVLALAVAGILLVRRSGSSSAGAPPSIAVLPFTNLSGDKDQEYFSDGLAEELMGLLGKVKQLRVAGRMSSFAFKGKTEDLATIGQKLHVSAVLEGSVRRVGDQLRISTQLVNVADGFQIWSETYDRKASDVFAVQDEIAAAVVAALKIKLLPSDRAIGSQSKTSNQEAYNQFLLGRRFFYLLSPDGYRRANAAFEKASELDPGYVAAYAWLSRSASQATFFSTTGAEKADLRRKAVWAAEEAVKRNPELAEGLAARGNARTLFSRDLAGAEADFSRALELDSGDPVTHAQHSRLLAKVGRLPQAIVEARKSAELDPLYPAPLGLLGNYLNGSGQLAEARQVLTRGLEIGPENEFARFYLGVNLLLQGDAKGARGVLGPAQTVFRRALLALTEHSLGHEQASRQALEELIARDGESQPYRVGEVYGWRGERDRAFEWLDRAVAQEDQSISYVAFDPLLAKLQGDPRYAALLKSLASPPAR
jgi:serine/threonine-protein kinase